ncbi:MAG: ABC transporter permease [Deltaproteobacteria bacterium]|nr:ABC transporter permease [Deltaproteobacteria bacterium]
MFVLARIGWRNLWRHRRRTLITAGAMAFGLGFCMAVVALVDGVYADLFDLAITENLGHAQVHDPEYPKKRAMWETVPDGDATLADIEGLTEVNRAAARLFGYALLGFGDNASGSQLIGIDPERETRMTLLEDKVVRGHYLGDDPAREVILGFQLAERLEVGLGDEVVAVTQAADGSIGNELYTVVGVFETGSVIKDRSAAFLHLADLQDLLVLPGQVHEIAFVAGEKEGIEPMLAAAGPVMEGRGLLLRSWREVNPQMAQMMEMADASSMILLIIIFGVASLGVLNTMLMSVFERTKELGVIRSLGLTPWQLVKLVFWETAALTCVAVLAGVPLGLALDAYLIFHGLDLTSVMEGTSVVGVTWNPLMMGKFDGGKVITVIVGLFVISFLAAIWPAIRAARLKPVEAMRLE